MAAGAWIALGENLSRNTVAGLCLSVAGVVCLTLLQPSTTTAVNALLGNSLEFAAMACAAANMVIIKQLCRRYNPWTLTALQVAAGTLFFTGPVAPGASAGIDLDR